MSLERLRWRWSPDEIEGRAGRDSPGDRRRQISPSDDLHLDS